jgi:hypothetical protein
MSIKIYSIGVNSLEDQARSFSVALNSMRFAQATHLVMTRTAYQ